jgi:hypothetical protein
MDNFITPDGIENMGGGAAFRFMPISNLYTLPRVIDGNIEDTVYTYGYPCLYTGYATQDTLEFTTQYDAEAMVWVTTLSGRTPVMSAAQTKLFRELIGTHLIVVYTDNNGVSYFLGTPTEPVIFTFGAASGQAGGSANGYTYTFKVVSREPVPTITAQILQD